MAYWMTRTLGVLNCDVIDVVAAALCNAVHGMQEECCNFIGREI